MNNDIDILERKVYLLLLSNLFKKNVKNDREKIRMPVSDCKRSKKEKLIAIHYISSQRLRWFRYILFIPHHTIFGEELFVLW